MDTKKHTILVTGAAGYVGSMLVERFAARDDVARVIGLDKEPLPEMLSTQTKLHYIQMNTASSWQEDVERFSPDIIIHTAWQIREIYNNHALTWKWNIDGSDAVFNYAFEHEEVTRLIHFSTVASYGAYEDNMIEHRYKEEEPFRPMDYLYAEEKRIAEQHLEDRYAKRQNKNIAVSIVRPAAVTGPRGRYQRIRFGLQATLAGQMTGSWAYRLVSLMVSFVPVTPKLARQFIHEDDVARLIERLAFGEVVPGYEAFNICPPGRIVLGKDLAHAVGKKTVPIRPWMARLAYFVLWHLTRGKIPTGKGSWKSYSYPIMVDGSKLTRMTGYQYQYDSYDAFYYTDGYYEKFVPEVSLRSKAVTSS